MGRGPGEIQRKILALLLGGIALMLSSLPKQSFRIIKDIVREWEKINKNTLKRAIRSLYESNLIGYKKNKDGSIMLFLTKDGKDRALTYKTDKMEIKRPEKWDKKWRVILFDIPERRRKNRDALRSHLKKLRFLEFQKSVFIHPYDCREQLDFLIELYNIRKFVRFIIAEHIDNELDIKQYFELG